MKRGQHTAWLECHLKPYGGPVLLAVAYYVGAEAAFLVGTLSDKIFAPFWPPNILLFCALVLATYRQWPIYFLAALPAHIAAERPSGAVLHDLQHELDERFGIRHTTIQFDLPGEAFHLSAI